MSELKKLKKSRSALRGQATKVINIGRAQLDLDPSDNNVEVIIQVLERITSLMPKIEVNRDQIFDYEEEDDQQDAEWDLSTQTIEDLDEMSASLKARRERMQLNTPRPQERAPSSQSVESDVSTRARVNVQLPKLNLPLFYGDIMKWKEFWDLYNSAVHEQPISDVAKFAYLKGALRSTALQAVEGISVTNDNYPVAYKLLEDKFGNKELIKQSLWAELSDLPAARSANDNKQLQACMEKLFRQMESLGIPINDYAVSWGLHLVKSKFTSKLVSDIISTSGGRLPADMKTLRTLLETYIMTNEMANVKLDRDKGFKHTNPQRGHSHSNYGTHGNSTSALISTTGNKNQSGQCAFCDGPHFADQCRRYSNKTAREQRIKELNNCFRCLKPGHQSTNCFATRPCFHCKKDHNSALCTKFQSGATTTNEGIANRDVTTMTANVNHEAFRKRVLLQTAKALIQSPDGKHSTMANVLLDVASQRSYITNKVAHLLKLNLSKTEHLSVNGFGMDIPHQLQTSLVNLSLKQKDGQGLHVQANTVKKIANAIIQEPLPAADVKLIKQLVGENELANTIPTNQREEEVDLLIGCDLYHEIVNNGGTFRLPSGLFLVKSTLGYLLTGAYQSTTASGQPIGSLLTITTPMARGCVETCLHTSVDDELLPKGPCVEDFFKLETIGITDSLKNEDDERALKKFNDTVKFSDGRYHVTWCWKEDNPKLPDNYGLAIGRMRSLANRLKGDTKLCSDYDKVIKQQVEQGIIEKVTPATTTGKLQHYLPHHPVVTPSKSTTKVRIVYDASSKVGKTSNSLNDCLYRGPNMLPDLCGLLMRFRTKPVAILADVEKAFLQVGLQSPDRDVTRFFWYKDSKKPEVVEGNIDTYRFCRLPFGVICSPFLLEATVKFHLNTNDNRLASDFADNIYVDNLVYGANTVDEAQHIYREAKSIFNKANMNLREWQSNSKQFMQMLVPADQGSLDSSKVLGIEWHQQSDEINLSSTNKLSDITTKRGALKAVAGIYDPLGFMNPITLHGKLFLQRLWELNKTWDEYLPQNMQDEWHVVEQLLKQVSTVPLPRLIVPSKPNSANVKYQLHTFCDASAKCYGAVVYLRSEVSNQTPMSHLVFSKMRLAPKEKKKDNLLKMSIPRLELMALLIGVRATEFVLKQLKLPVTKKMLWSDSECTLHWLTTKKPLSIFVENRLKEIRCSNDIQFNHVGTKDNPADLITRGTSANDLKQTPRWWHGPKWLVGEESKWPEWKSNTITSEAIEKAQTEIKSSSKCFLKSTALVATAPLATNKQTPLKMDETRFSSLNKLLRVTSYALKFIKVKLWNRLPDKQRNEKYKDFKSIMEQVDDGEITSPLMSLSKTLWERYTQTNHLHGIKTAVADGKKHPYSMLGVQADGKGILRCHGRLQFADLGEDLKNPKLLPRNAHFTKLVIEDAHRSLMHSGVGHTLTHVRNQYWIPKGRAAVRSVISKCIPCRKLGGASFQLPTMPSWPRERVTRSLPFQYTGLDYLGPINVKYGPDIKKIWICIFTCLAVRTIHLKWVSDLSAKEFLNCLRRFISRRGKPDQIISDNAPQFKVVSATLNTTWKSIQNNNDVQAYISHQGIEWKYITQLSPWKGGFYERLVGLVKQAMRKTIGRSLLTLEQMITMVIETEAVINSRPLTYSYEDFDSGFVLTPAHFLASGLKTGLPDLPVDANDGDYQPDLNSQDKLIVYWQKEQDKLNKFWRFWSEEYLLSLRENLPASKHKGPRSEVQRIPKVGEVVLIKEENLPRGTWKLAVVQKLIQSKDGGVRSAEVHTLNGRTLTRSINHLFPLEIETSSAIPTHCQNQEKKRDETNTDTENRTTNQIKPKEQYCRRAAAKQARQRLTQLFEEKTLVTLFSPAGSVMDFAKQSHETDLTQLA